MADVTGTYYEGEAIVGYGAQLLVGQNDDPETYAAVADVMSITPGDMTTEIVDKTHLRSPEAHREKKATIRDSGPFALEGNWRPRHGSHSNSGGDGFADGGLVYLWRRRLERNFILRLLIGEAADSISVTLTSAAGVATATAGAAHGLASGDVVVIAGATQPEYNGTFSITVLTATTFTYEVDGAPVSPATGTITATPTGELDWPFRGVVSKYQPGQIVLNEKIPFSAEVTPLSDFSANLP